MQIEEPLLGWVLLAARLCLAAVFLVSGVQKALNYANAREEFHRAALPATEFLLPLTISLHLLASTGLISGIYSRESALLLAAFTVAATVKVHCFWRMAGSERLERSRIALSNLAIVGGLLLLAAIGPGRLVL
jgi:putative oxidoreductase